MLCRRFGWPHALHALLASAHPPLLLCASSMYLCSFLPVLVLLFSGLLNSCGCHFTAFTPASHSLNTLPHCTSPTFSHPPTTSCASLDMVPAHRGLPFSCTCHLLHYIPPPPHRHAGLQGVQAPLHAFTLLTPPASPPVALICLLDRQGIGPSFTCPPPPFCTHCAAPSAAHYHTSSLLTYPLATTAPGLCLHSLLGLIEPCKRLRCQAHASFMVACYRPVWLGTQGQPGLHMQDHLLPAPLAQAVPCYTARLPQAMPACPYAKLRATRLRC